jgi:multidrug efflux pump subunit AcrA (membrane-fusion protein)
MMLLPRCTTAAIAALICFTVASAGFAQQGSGLITIGLSEPSEERQLAFSDLGVVDKTNFKEGDTIKAGDIIMTQDAAELQKELEWLELQASSQARVKAAEADLEVKRIRLGRIDSDIETSTREGRRPAFSASEREEAHIQVIGAEANLQLSREQQQEAALKAAQMRIRIERSRLKSPINGFIRRLNTGVGEVSGPTMQDGACVVVSNDPIRVRVPEVATPLVNMLKPGDEMEVRYLEDKNWQRAKVVFFDPVGDIGAETREFRLELANPSGRESGRRMEVRLPQHLAQAHQQLTQSLP